jgi:bifunctional UDP-N-acetylglucosamine pyrophosphorylase/glucosamine-1-phosphate N-acetyltransferase
MSSIGARELGAENICVVHGHGGEQVRAALDAPDLAWALQEPQLGTGHAVMQALPHLDIAVSPAPTFTLVLYGDVPLTRAATLRRLVEAAGSDKLALLTAYLDNPTARCSSPSLNAIHQRNIARPACWSPASR